MPKIEQELALEAVKLMGTSTGEGQIEVTGKSMLPHLLPGDHVWVRFEGPPFQRGEIVVFGQAGSLLIHRIVGFKAQSHYGPHYRIRGDHAAYFDGPTAAEAILGRVVAVQSAGNWRTLESAPARFYGRMVASHAFFWPGVRSVVERLERRLGFPERISRVVGWKDQWLLKIVKALFYPLCHRKIPAPTQEN